MITGSRPSGTLPTSSPTAKTTASVSGRPAPNVGERDERDTGRDRDQRDQPGHPPHLRLQRALLSLDPLRQRGDPPQLGVHAGREDERRAPRPRCRWSPRTPGRAPAASGTLVSTSSAARKAGTDSPRQRREVDLDAAGRAGARRPRCGPPPRSRARHRARGRRASITCSRPSRSTFACVGQVCGERLDRPLRLHLLREREGRVDQITTTIATATGTIPATQASAAAAHSSSASGWVNWLHELPRPAPAAPPREHVRPVTEPAAARPRATSGPTAPRRRSRSRSSTRLVGSTASLSNVIPRR